MSEKRFEVENERTVYDNLLHRGFVCSWKVDAQELVGLLNSLVDENRELRQTVTHLEEECGARENDIVNLKKENEQLKEINKEIGDDLYNCRLKQYDIHTIKDLRESFEHSKKKG